MSVDFLPRDALPGHLQRRALRCGALPLTHTFTFHDTGPTSAYPGHSPRPWLLRASFSRVACGWCLLREVTGSQRATRGYSVPSCHCSHPEGGALHRVSRQCKPVNVEGCRRLILCLLTPACQPLALVRHSRWLNHTFTFVAHRCLRDGIPRVRLPGFRRLAPLQTFEDQSPIWGLRCHSCTWREGLAPSWNAELRGYRVTLYLAVYPEAKASFRPTGRTSTKRVLICLYPSKYHTWLRRALPRMARTSTRTTRRPW